MSTYSLLDPDATDEQVDDFVAELLGKDAPKADDEDDEESGEKA